MHCILARLTVQRQYGTHVFLSKKFRKKLESFWSFEVNYFVPQNTPKTSLLWETVFWLKKWFDTTAKARRRNIWREHYYEKPPPISTTKSVGIPFWLLLFIRIEPTTTLHKASTGNASRDGGIIWKGTYFDFHRRASALKECLNMHVDCISLFSLS